MFKNPTLNKYRAGSPGIINKLIHINWYIRSRRWLLIHVTDVLRFILRTIIKIPQQKKNKTVIMIKRYKTKIIELNNYGPSIKSGIGRSIHMKTNTNLLTNTKGKIY